jgi:RNA polymerase-binding transcription factor DksA
MAIKKKTGKPVKKTPPKKVVKPAAKKSAPAKKAVHKPVAKKTAPAKKHPAKPVAKKLVPIKKTAAAKPALKKVLPVVHSKPTTAKPIASKIEPKKQEHKYEIKQTAHPIVKHEVKKPTPPSKPLKVVMPEIKTKTVRKYEPEFTKSVLDTLQQDSTGPTMRYSDSELVEFRDLIMKKLEAAKKELAYLQGLITRKDEMGGDETDNRYMTMEDGSMSMEREQLSQMASRQITFIDHLEKAIMRIENKTYGICRVTGKLIDKARLRAVPHATLSIEAKQTMNK